MMGHFLLLRCIFCLTTLSLFPLIRGIALSLGLVLSSGNLFLRFLHHFTVAAGVRMCIGLAIRRCIILLPFLVWMILVIDVCFIPLHNLQFTGERTKMAPFPN
jgi:hypothetical protein